MTIKIEKNIPIPEARSGKQIYPWDALDVGDSFAFRDGVTSGTAHRQAHAAGKKYGRKFSVRTRPDGTHRCWRVA